MNSAVAGSSFTVTANANAGTITFETVGLTSLRSYNDTDLSTRVNGLWSGEFYSSRNPMSINAVYEINSRPLQVYDVNKPFTTGFVDLQPLHSLYLASNRLSTYSKLGPCFAT
jgi:hypothetical protein